ncbi:disulfide bond formation protein B [Nioella nitratireducens]|uniref:disulfide bond formation protein B n=1 Tax=Nioella nitratireducens TaxID=1287720 RepID=UPI0008FD2567|nr:disulfide bond formation protein B [Nioella nitratireducens]
MTLLNSLSRRNLILLAGLGSAALFLGALFFQFVIGIEPCTMCFWQRWPHRIGIGLGLVGLAFPRAIVAWLGGLNMLVSTGLAMYHTGVERHWWLGPTTCTSRGVDLSAASDCGLLDPDCGAPIVLCDQIAWDLFGLSMANYNVIISLGLAVIWVMAARRKA